MDKIIDELDEIAEADAADLVCQKCQSILNSPRSRCPRCGFLPSGEAMATQPPPPATTPDEEEGSPLCPVCDSVVSMSDTVCPNCGAEFLAEEDEWEEEEEAVFCPACNHEVSLDVAVCPHCGAEFDEGEEDEEAIFCPACNHEVSLDVAVCPHCGAEFDEGEDLGPLPSEEETRRPKPVAPQPEIVVIPRPAVVKVKAIKTSPSTMRQREYGPRGLSNGASAVNGVGIINGKGLVNGKHFINGMGAVNGRDMVNGTGFINGKESEGLLRRRRHQFITRMRWQFLAVLVAILIIIPTFMYLSHLKSQSPYTVDGDFGDWEGSTVFSVMSESSSPSTNVVEWAIDSHNKELYLYAKTEHHLMGSASAERVVLFIDTDGSADSGYSVASIGADYMFDILGWNGSVKSSILSEFRLNQESDQLDWNSWRVVGLVTAHVAASEIEAMARLPVHTNESTQLLLTTQNEEDECCVSYAVPLEGGLLIVEQLPVPEVALSDILIQDAEAALLRLRFTSQGRGGEVTSVTPVLEGATSFSSIPRFSLEAGDTDVFDIRVDSSYLSPGDYVSAKVTAQGIESTFSSVQIIGYGASAYCSSPPGNITIDGAFGDWSGKTVKDADGLPIVNRNVDIDEVGAERSSVDAFFYLSVYGELCAGVYIPKACAIPSGTGAGSVVTERKTAEDYIKIFIDSDRSTETGELVSLGTMTIGTDYIIGISGVNCDITSAVVLAYFAGTWVELSFEPETAKDERRMEIAVPSASIGSPEDVEFIVEMTDWRGGQDLATNVSLEGMKGWAVEDTSATDATMFSYQRKLFYDGTNYWSLFSDGSNTLCKYSSDGGETWTFNSEDSGRVFSNSGIEYASLWYDSVNQTVYAIGDNSTASVNVNIQKGTVSPETPSISWATTDTTLSVSVGSIGSKATFISMDAGGHIWILARAQTQTSPARHNLVSYQSDSDEGDISDWTSRGSMMTTAGVNADLKGSILPAGSGSDMWAVYNHDSQVDARKYESGSWENVENVYTDTGALGFMNTAPASAVIDGNGVLHVVYGDANKDGATEKPQIQYEYRNSGGWSSPLELDVDATSVAHYYPTISLDTSTGDVYALWIETTGYNIACKKNDSGSWDFVTLSQTSYTKQYLTSIYAVSGESHICWQWTQNTTGNIDVVFDVIPEFDDIVVPILIMIAVFFVGLRRRRAVTRACEEL